MDRGGGEQRQHVRVALMLAGQIKDGRLAPGDKVPSITTLCTAHGCSRGVAVRALQLLGSWGLACKDGGRGWVVAAAGAKPARGGVALPAGPHSGERHYEEAAASLRARIASGGLAAGASLPRASVCEEVFCAGRALGLLESENLVRREPGVGYFAAGRGGAGGETVLYKRAAAWLREEIRSGRLKPGAKVPSGSALAEKCGCSRPTAGIALRVLASEGLIFREPDGYFGGPRGSVQAERVYQRLAARLRKEITSGQLAPGTKLPSVRRGKWGCSQRNASLAVKLLESQGLVHRTARSGYVVGAPGSVRVEPQYTRVAARLREQIASGQLPPGTTLPKITSGTQWGCSQRNARLAVRLLESQGLVYWAGRFGYVVGRRGTVPLGKQLHVPVAARLREQITSGRLAEGTKLPPVSSREQWGSPASAAETTLRLLEEQGLVYRGGRRYFVAEPAGPMVPGSEPQHHLAATSQAAQLINAASVTGGQIAAAPCGKAGSR